jgi:hypothetical protein
MDDKACVAQRADIAQNRAPGCSHLGGKGLDGRGAGAAQGAHEGLMAQAYVNSQASVHLVTNFVAFSI